MLYRTADTACTLLACSHAEKVGERWLVTARSCILKLTPISFLPRCSIYTETRKSLSSLSLFFSQIYLTPVVFPQRLATTFRSRFDLVERKSGLWSDSSLGDSSTRVYVFSLCYASRDVYRHEFREISCATCSFYSIRLQLDLILRLKNYFFIVKSGKFFYICATRNGTYLFHF